MKQTNPAKKLIGNDRFLVLFIGIIGFVMPMIYGYEYGFAIPHVHDEFAYLFVADTFANGKITNETPPSPESFEAPHILVKPTYTAKYPPLQSLVLAFGTVLFGHPIFGVWLSCGLAAAASLWMMLAWTRRNRAIAGTLLMIAFIGIDTYWAQSYWGGMVAATGGALFLGAFRRLYKNFSVGNTVFMTLGGIILVNSRPFEGTMMMVLPAFALLIRLFRNQNFSLSEKFGKVILPAVLLTAAAVSAMAYYNFRVTGNALRLPYTEHQSQYFSTPLFIFQSPSESNLQGNERLKKLYGTLTASELIRHIDSYGLPEIKQLYPLYAFLFLWINFPYLLMMPPLIPLLYISAFYISTKSRRTLFLTAIITFTFFCMSFATYWDQFHYCAPLTSCFYLLLVQGLRYFTIKHKTNRQKYLLLALISFMIFAALAYKRYYAKEWFFFLSFPVTENLYKDIEIDLNQTTYLSETKNPQQLKSRLEQIAESSNDKYIALVSYSKDFNIHQDIVFNRSDLANSKLIWANDLGEEKNSELLTHFGNRKVLKIKIFPTKITMEPIK